MRGVRQDSAGSPCFAPSFSVTQPCPRSSLCRTRAGQQTLSIATGHTNNMLCMWLEAEFLFTAGLDGLIKVWVSTLDSR